MVAGAVPALAAWFVWGPLGIVSYVGGLFNSMLTFMVLLLVALPTPAAVIGLPVLVVYTACTWRRQTRSGRRSLILWMVATAGLACPFCLGLAGLSPSPFDMFVRGFVRYVERRADIGAIQGWVSTLDPNELADEYGTVEKLLADSDQPPAVKRLSANSVMAMLDDRGHPMVRLLWGSGMIGHWGIMVGRKDMAMPPSDASDSGEHRFPLAPEAYIWSGG
ncbi:MAG: hypothetical protein A2Y77_07095 [Planctomycetes bacterium RBG_13_62_9]|nr:MAG: hypothetical protein A2Y77_07095 [Planctomycetes bacterium RBG_13_62_9]